MAFTSVNRTALIQAMEGESVVIYVGTERKRYLIHKDLLTKQSEFFNGAFNGKFREAEENSIYLEEESPAAFDLLVGWLYQGHIPTIAPPFGGFKKPDVDTSDKDPLVPGTILQLESTDGTRFRRLIGPSNVDVWMGMGSQAPPAKNEGTSQVAYQPYTEPSAAYPLGPAQIIGALDLFKSISSQKEYRNWSPEELRLADYSADRKWNTDFSVQLPPDLNGIDDSLEDNDADVSDDSPTAPLVPPFTQFQTGHVPGIPHSPPLSTLTTAEETHQLALLNLCLLSEHLCWTPLFNLSISAYLLGEATLGTRRALPAAHIALIYTRSHAASPCRRFAADSAVSHLRDAGAQLRYAGLCREFPAFLADVLASAGRNPALGWRDPTRRGGKAEGRCAYHVHERGERCVSTCLDEELRRGSENGSFGKVEQEEGEGRSAFGQLTQARAWMGWREMVALLSSSGGNQE